MQSVVVVILALVAFVSGYGEPDPNTNGRPVYQERANFNLINVVRVAPVQYKTLYMGGYSPDVSAILNGTVYPAVAPLYWEPRLGASAYNHSNEMATKNYFAHNSYDGTDTFTRIGMFYTCKTGWARGEDIAAGMKSPLDTSNQWLCDKPFGKTYCPLDGAKDSNNYPLDGHRGNIMSSGFASAGVGFGSNPSASYTYYWTQDFGTACTGQTSPIYSGSHYIMGSNVKFVAVFASTNAATSSSVVINGVSQALTMESGTSTRGSFAATVASTSGCRSYYFTFVANGVTFRYPDTGCLMTNLEGSCATDFDATCGGSAASTTAKATTGTGSTTSAAGTGNTTARATSTSGARSTGSTTTPGAGIANQSGATTLSGNIFVSICLYLISRILF